MQGPSLDRAVIFQSHALMPWLSALGNVELAVSSRHPGWSRRQIREHALKYLALVHLDGSEHKKPAQLSGGMKQRVGIARALAIEPRMLLMDEPFSALDALTRGALQDEVMAIRRATQQTIFMITHDVDEALLLADKILLMTNGPSAWIAEVVENTLPKERSRTELHKLANYYPLRNHLIDFLVTRSRELSLQSRRRARASAASRPIVRPTAAGSSPSSRRHMSRRPRIPPRQRKRRPPIVPAAELPWRKPRLGAALLRPSAVLRSLERALGNRRAVREDAARKTQPREQDRCSAKT